MCVSARLLSCSLPLCTGIQSHGGGGGGLLSAGICQRSHGCIWIDRDFLTKAMGFIKCREVNLEFVGKHNLDFRGRTDGCEDGWGLDTCGRQRPATG